jgi:hypothetical protein
MVTLVIFAESFINALNAMIVAHSTSRTLLLFPSLCETVLSFSHGVLLRRLLLPMAMGNVKGVHVAITMKVIG